jgi:RNA polymerase sigma-70 factor (ECF subfamily)
MASSLALTGPGLADWKAAAVVPMERDAVEPHQAGEVHVAPGTLDSLPEAELIAACLAGRPHAFDLIVERHRRAVYQLCYRFVGNHEDASDLSQDVFLRAFRGLKSFRGQSSVGTWLYRIGVNVCLNRVSVRKPASEPIDEGQHVDTRSESPSDRVLRGERAARVRAAVAELPPKQRAALILRVYQEMSHQEIANVLGSSVGAVKANVFHALQNLKRLLGDDVL